MSIINPENFLYPETNKEVAEIATTYDKMESALDAGNVSYLKVFDVTTSTFQFLSRLTCPLRFLSWSMAFIASIVCM